MRKTIHETILSRNLLLAIGLLAIPNQTMAALDCQARPSCDELGYVYSASDCNGISAVKCPFDQSRLFCNKAVTTPTPTPSEPSAPTNWKDCQVGQYYSPTSQSCGTSQTDYLVVNAYSNYIRTAYVAQESIGVAPGFGSVDEAQTYAAQWCSDKGLDNDLLLDDELTLIYNKGLYERIKTAESNGMEADIYWIAGNNEGCVDTTIMGGNIDSWGCNPTYGNYGIICGKAFRDDNASSELTQSMPTCSAGQYYNPSTKTCGTSVTDYYVLEVLTDEKTVKAAYVASQSAFEVTKEMLPNANIQCLSNGYDYDLLKTSELETLYNEGIITTVIAPGSANTGADIMFAASDGTGCYDSTISGAGYYTCSGSSYSVICPKTFNFGATSVEACASGTYYDASEKKCNTTPTNQLVMGTSGSTIYTVDISSGVHGLVRVVEQGGDTSVATTDVATARTKAVEYCQDQGGVLLTKSEVETVMSIAGSDVLDVNAAASTTNIVTADGCWDISLGAGAGLSNHICANAMPSMFICKIAN